MSVDLTKLNFERIKHAENRKAKHFSWKVIVAFVISIIWLVPFYFLLTSIFKSTTEYAMNTPISLPHSFFPFIENVKSAWVMGNMRQAMSNSLMYSFFGAGIAVFFSAMAAFSLIHLDMKRKTFWFMWIFSGTVFPFQMFIIPLFFGYQYVGILNTKIGMLLFYIAVCIPFATLVLRNFMMGLSHEINDAARIDGAGEFTVFFKIVLPNSIGSMTAVFLLQFTWVWNDLLFSIVLGNRPETRSIMNALMVFQGNYSSTGANIVLTATLLSSLPSIILFFLLRKHFMEGLKV
ncbi:MAG: carbohydrate ABC transporter permease [Ostreibacterium sp.]